ncbi:Hypothetical predicted protein, partial [Podarcis lilfordi]
MPQCHLPGRATAFGVARNVNSTPADGKSSFMMEQAMAWEFPSIFQKDRIQKHCVLGYIPANTVL